MPNWLRNTLCVLASACAVASSGMVVIIWTYSKSSFTDWIYTVFMTLLTIVVLCLTAYAVYFTVKYGSKGGD